MRRASDAPTIAELPVALLGHVMALACGDEGAAAAPCLRLVSRCWHAVFWSEPGLWHVLSLSVHKPEVSAEDREQRRAGKQRLLQRVSDMVTAVDILGFPQEEGGQPPGEDATEAAIACLQQLQPGTLTKVTLRWEAALPAAILQALPRFSQTLTGLEVYCLELPPAAAPLLAQLTQLEELECYYWDEEQLVGQALPRLPAEVATALAQLTNLTSLVLGLGLHGNAAHSLAAALLHLPHLRKLRVAPDGPPGLPELQQFIVRIAQQSQLTELDLSAPRHRLGSLECLTRLTGLQHLGLHEGWAMEGMPADNATSQFPLPTAFPALREYNFTSHSNSGSPSAGLTFALPAAGFILSGCGFGVDGKLSVRRLPKELSFKEVLPLLKPPNCQLKSVAIGSNTAPEGLLSECCQLPALRGLDLLCGTGELTLADAALPQLRYLYIASKLRGRLGTTPHLGLRLERVALPVLEELHFASSGGSLSLQRLALPALCNLEVRASGSASITHTLLPALQSLHIVSDGDVQLAHTSMPALTKLVVEGKGKRTAGGHAQPSLLLVDMVLPALQEMTVNTSSASLRRVCMPVLHTLQLTGQPGWEAVDVVLPALRKAHLRKPEGNLVLPIGLEELHLLGLPSLPLELTALIQLRRLVIEHPLSSFDLSREDVDTILCRLPRLTDLRMPWMRCVKPRVLLHLFNSIPQLEVPDSWI